MKTIQDPMLKKLLIQYGEGHLNSQNVLLHNIGIPLIILGAIGLLSNIPSPIPVEYIVGLLILFYYFSFKSVRTVAVWIAMFLVLVAVQKNIILDSIWLWLFLLAIGWILLGIGHRIEGSKPRFLEEIRMFLIGPIWIFRGFL